MGEHRIASLKKEFLEKAITPESSFCMVLEGLLKDAFMKVFPVSQVENFAVHYMQTLHQFRDTKALVHYLRGSIEKLDVRDRKKMERAYFKFVGEVLEGNFQSGTRRGHLLDGKIEGGKDGPPSLHRRNGLS